MKLRLKFDKKSLRQFFIDHTEKIVFGAVVACFLVVAYQAIERRGFELRGKSRNDSKPENLDKAVEAAQKNIYKESQPYDPKLQITDFKGIIEGSRQRVDWNVFATSIPWYRDDVKPTSVLRPMPTVLPVERLLAEAGRGPVVTAAGTVEGKGAKPSGGGVQGQRWVLLKGLVPLKKQKEAYKSAFQNASFQDKGKDAPIYWGFFVERAEVVPGSPAALKWDRLFRFNAGTTPDDAQKLAASAGEVVDGKFVRAGLVYPLPPVTNRAWGPEAAYPPEIPLADKSGPEPGTHLPGKDGENAPPDELGGAPAKPATAPEKAKVEEEQDSEYLLFRFFDVDVQPGKQYRYRVFLVLKNPNYQLEGKYLTDPALATPQYLGEFVRDADQRLRPNTSQAGWSEFSPAAAVPNDIQLLAVSVQPTRQGQEPVGMLRVVKYIERLGVNSWGDFPVVRGKMADFPEIKDPRNDIIVSYLTDALIVDLAGEKVSPRERLQPQPRPGQILVLEKSGRLVIRDVVQDDELFRRINPPQEKPQPKPKGGGPGPGPHPKTPVDPFGGVDPGVFGEGKKQPHGGHGHGM
ncbi:MAG: hypothetical protein ABR915_03060 [Thermoguttaceae bacterium]|jgi:hypothetical protein